MHTITDDIITGITLEDTITGITPDKDSNSPTLANFPPSMLKAIQFVDNQFSLPEAFIKHLQIAVPTVNIGEIVDECIDWIRSRNFVGVYSATLVKFMTTASVMPIDYSKKKQNDSSITEFINHNFTIIPDTPELLAKIADDQAKLAEKKIKTAEKVAKTALAKKESDQAGVRLGEKESWVARYDNALASCDLFCHVNQRGNGVQIKPEMRFEVGNYKYRIVAPPIGAPEQTMLLALMFLARQQDAYKELTPGRESEGLVPDIAFQDDECGNELITTDTGGKLVMTIKTSPTELARTCGLSFSGQRAETIEDTIQNLCAVNMKMKNKMSGKWDITQLISKTKGDRLESIEVSLNFRLTEILLISGNAGGGNYAGISLTSHHLIKTNVGRLLHTWLCVWGGNKKDMSRPLMETMIKQVYGSVSNNKVELHRQRSSIHAALGLIATFPEFRYRKLPLGYGNIPFPVFDPDEIPF